MRLGLFTRGSTWQVNFHDAVIASVLAFVVISTGASASEEMSPVALAPAPGRSVAEESESDWEGVHFANYVEVEDLPTLQKLGINAVVMELGKKPQHWRMTYDACIKHQIKLVPVLWGKGQSIWKWNGKAEEWELDVRKYSKSLGAKFMGFLRENPGYLRQTFAVYSFHEPWYIPDDGKRAGTVRPARLRKFWQQVREMFSGKLKVYGEEVSWAPECKNGCVDYDYVTLYSFASRDGKPVYRPGGRKLVGKFGIDGAHGPVELNREKVKQKERQQIALMHQSIRTAPAAADGTRTKLIALMGTFAHDEEPALWNRMPDADEMREWIKDIVLPERNRLAGVGWYAFRNPTDYYTSYLYKDRTDSRGEDRWEAIRDASKMLEMGFP